jgi:hypothetical protein
MEHDEAKRRYTRLPADVQVRVLASFGHNLTIAARDTYECQARCACTAATPRHQIQHRVFTHILKLLADDPQRYPDDVLLSIMLEHDDDHLSA